MKQSNGNKIENKPSEKKENGKTSHLDITVLPNHQEKQFNELKPLINNLCKRGKKTLHSHQLSRTAKKIVERLHVILIRDRTSTDWIKISTTKNILFPDLAKKRQRKTV